MRDLTEGSIPKQLLQNSIPIAIGMFAQTLYYLVDLYFVGKLGDVELAGVSAAGNLMIISIALTQIISVGTATLISHSFGRKDQEDANQVFNQSLLISSISGTVVVILGYFGAESYLRLVASDQAVVLHGEIYLYWFLPSITMQLFMSSIGSAMRATGLFKPSAVIPMITVLVNIILSPILITGWGTGYPMGVAGAGLSTSLAVAVGVIILSFYYVSLDRYFTMDLSKWRPSLKTINRILAIGGPAGGELIFLFFNMAAIFWAIQHFGADAQAGFGLGSRVMQAITLPTLAIAFAATPIAAQNFGAKNYSRVVETFWRTIFINSGIMLLFTAICFQLSEFLVKGFSNDQNVIEISAIYLKINALGLLASGLAYVCSSLFQALGNTWPALLSTTLSSVTLIATLLCFSKKPGFHIEQVWQLQVAVCFVHAAISCYLIRRQFSLRLSIPEEKVKPCVV